MDVEVAAFDLQTLERIHFDYANFKHIVLFIKKNTNRREIIIDSFDNARYLQDTLKYDYDDVSAIKLKYQNSWILNFHILTYFEQPLILSI